MQESRADKDKQFFNPVETVVLWRQGFFMDILSWIK